MTTQRRRGGTAAAAVTVVAWAAAFPAIRAGLEGFPPWALGAARLAGRIPCAGSCSGGAAPGTTASSPLGPGRTGRAVGQALYQGLLMTGEVSVPAGTASILIATAPLFSVVAAVLLLHEPVRAALPGMLVAFAGIALVGLSLGMGGGVAARRGPGRRCMSGALPRHREAADRRVRRPLPRQRGRCGRALPSAFRSCHWPGNRPRPPRRQRSSHCSCSGSSRRRWGTRPGRWRCSTPPSPDHSGPVPHPSGGPPARVGVARRATGPARRRRRHTRRDRRCRCAAPEPGLLDSRIDASRTGENRPYGRRIPHVVAPTRGASLDADACGGCIATLAHTGLHANAPAHWCGRERGEWITAPQAA